MAKELRASDITPSKAALAGSGKRATTRTTLTLDKDVKERAAVMLREFGMDMSTAVNIIFADMLRTRKFPATLTLPEKEKTAFDLTASETVAAAVDAVEHRDALPSAAGQKGYVISLDTETGKPYKLFPNGEREFIHE